VAGAVEDGEVTWQLFTASVQGASHLSSATPNQDAVASRGDHVTGSLAIAVADGHGDPRHFRSGRGSRFAVQVGCDLALQFAHSLGGDPEQASLPALLGTELTPAVVAAWRRAVRDDLQAHPLTPEEAAVAGREALVAYGSTLLVALLSEAWAVVAQIGDGDILAVEPGGNAVSPLPPDPWIRGRFTTSLCQEDPLGSFRTAALDLRREPLDVLLLATDGFGNSQVDDPWYQPFARDLMRQIRERGAARVGAGVGDWAARCASREGSGDDTTIALAVRGAPAA
jgi:serine/threonine protein phosphatase PrpC